MGEVVPTAAASLATPQDAGRMVSTAGTHFGNRAVLWTDLPTGVRSAITTEQALLAAAEVDDSSSRVRRGPDGQYYQPWQVWYADRDGIRRAELRRDLTRGRGKQFRPTGQFRVADLVVYPAAAVPDRRRGTVPTTAQQHPSSGAGGVDADPRGDQLGYLPLAVQQEVRAAVPTPEYAHGSLRQWSTGQDGRPYRQDLVLLRLAPPAAVVLVATKEADALPSHADAAAAQRVVAGLPWQITRYRYQLHPPGTSHDAGRVARQ